MGDQKIKIIKTLEKFKKEVSKIIKLDKIILFGSRAKGKAKKTSDVDLLIISKDFEGKKYFRRSPQFYLMWKSEYDADILCLTPTELEEKEKKIGIIKEAIKEGIEIK